MSGILHSATARPFIEILRLSRNGIVYGGKIRFSHALVINLLYRSGPLKPRLILVLQATKGHASVLAGFAIVYKTACKILENGQLLGKQNNFLVKILAGAFGAWIVYSQHFPYFNPGITHQITLYCFSRVLIACCKILLDNYLHCRQPTFTTGKGNDVKYADLSEAQKKAIKNGVYNTLWKYFAVATWALVMVIYDYYPQYLQSSLRHSMTYIYDVEQQNWDTWRDFLGI